MKALVGAFNQEKALVGAFSVIVQPVVEPTEHYTALVPSSSRAWRHYVAIGSRLMGLELREREDTLGDLLGDLRGEDL